MIMSRLARIITLSTILSRPLHQAHGFLPSVAKSVVSDSKFSKGNSVNKNHQFKVQRMSSAMSAESKKRVLVPIADDSEEIETSCITDTLVRFGAEVVVASVKPDGELVCKMSRGLKICADVSIEDAANEEWDLIALPGGMPGASHLRDCESLVAMLKKQKEAKKLYAAVCASPAVVLQSQGLLGSKATCYPAPPFRSTMTDPSDDKVVIQDGVVTSQGPGTSLLFAISLGEQLVSSKFRKKVIATLQNCKRNPSNICNLLLWKSGNSIFLSLFIFSMGKRQLIRLQEKCL